MYLTLKFNIGAMNISTKNMPVLPDSKEFRHNRMVKSPHENYFNVCRQHEESEVS